MIFILHSSLKKIDKFLRGLEEEELKLEVEVEVEVKESRIRRFQIFETVAETERGLGSWVPYQISYRSISSSLFPFFFVLFASVG